MTDTTLAPQKPLSIGALSRACGVPVETLRIWERRYGKPTARRRPSGHRRYDAADAAWLRTVAEAVVRGVRPSIALRMPPESLRVVVAAAATPVDRDAASVVEAARRFDGAAIRRLVRVRRRGEPMLGHLTSRIAPILEAVGRAWSEQRIAVRHEHFVSEIVDDHLRALRNSVRPRRSSLPVAFATLAGDRHVLGLQMCATLAASRGLRPVILGGDTPSDDIAAACREAGAAALVVSVSMTRGGVDADALLATVRAAVPPHVRIAAGGAGAAGPRRPPVGVEFPEGLAGLDRFFAEIAGAPRP